MNPYDMPTYVWEILADLLEYEDEHGRDLFCAHGILNRLPTDVHTMVQGYLMNRRLSGRPE